MRKRENFVEIYRRNIDKAYNNMYNLSRSYWKNVGMICQFLQKRARLNVVHYKHFKTSE